MSSLYHCLDLLLSLGYSCIDYLDGKSASCESLQNDELISNLKNEFTDYLSSFLAEYYTQMGDLNFALQNACQANLMDENEDVLENDPEYLRRTLLNDHQIDPFIVDYFIEDKKKVDISWLFEEDSFSSLLNNLRSSDHSTTKRLGKQKYIPQEESPAPVRPVIKRECSICFENFILIEKGLDYAVRRPGNCSSQVDLEGVCLSGCGCTFCFGCLSKYIKNCLKSKSSLVKCPGESCKTSIYSSSFYSDEIAILEEGEILPTDPFMARLEFTDSDWEKWREMELLNSLQAEEILYCPKASCSALLVKGSFHGPEASCLKCGTVFCHNCRTSSFHYGMSCSEYQQIPIHQRPNLSAEEIAVEMLISSKKWMKCPTCSTNIEKQDGCRFIKCSFCTTGFCYKCGEKYKDLEVANPAYPHGTPGCTCLLFEEDEINAAGAADPPMVNHFVQHVHVPPVVPRREEIRNEEVQLLGLESRLVHRYKLKSLPSWHRKCTTDNTCPSCDRQFPTLRSMEQHLLATRQHPVWACCGRVFLNAEGYRRHRDMTDDHLYVNYTNSN